MPQRPDAFSPAVRLQHPGCRQPHTQSDSLHGGGEVEQVKTITIYSREATQKRNHLQTFAPARRLSNYL